MNKISLIGAGNIGGTLAHLLALKKLGNITLIDVVTGMPQGKALDLSQSSAVEGFTGSIEGTNDFSKMKGSDVIIITAGLPRKPGMSRDDLLEINGKIIFKENYYFDEIDKTAILLNHENVVSDLNDIKKRHCDNGKSLTLKWKVALKNNHEEEANLEEILSQIGNNIKLRIDANGSWGREIANRWADILKDNNNIDWLEQPLCVDDIDGLTELNKKIPIALDESLLKFPNLIDEWKGWQIRRPSQENNPVKLLRELENKKALISISTSFETGIGKRWLYHLSSLQLQGPTPKVPGLAMNKFPNSFLFLNEAKKIWDQL